MTVEPERVSAALTDGADPARWRRARILLNPPGMYQLCLDAPITEVVERIADRVVEVEPRIRREIARDIADLLLRARVRQTVSCGFDAACRPQGMPIYGGEPAPPVPCVRPCGFRTDDVHALPHMFAAAAADRVHPEDRAEVENALAGAFRATLAPLLRANPRCGAHPVCAADVTDPFVE